ncbi:MAG: carboxylating nicotinate-nucleotide diphosphorylase [Methanobacteriaceae archaeon]|nr:carboxylating nicotinate-nucleotide diphosphorylase [Methanobacteriaceae archaeon]
MKDALMQMILDDIGFEDITTNALVPPDLNIKARIISRQKGLIAGMDLVKIILEEFQIKIIKGKKDGNPIKANETVMEFEGNARSILTIERTILNLIMRMSGIATITSQALKKVRSVNKDIIIAGTRKTTPGLQFYEKKAVYAGGGDPHRFRLDDCVMIKDNHLIVVGDIGKAIKKAKEYVSFTKKIEVEVENEDDAIKAVKSGADIVMFDNMSPEDIKKTIKILKNEKIRDNVILEASGGINLSNILEYALTGVDIISIGFITHSASTLDMSLEII